MKSLFTPNQILATALLGGPLSALYALHQNARQLAAPTQPQQILSGGIPIIMLLMSLAPFVQDFTLKLIIPLTYSLAARALAQHWHETALITGHAQPQSIRQVVTISLLGLIAFALLSVVWLSAMDALGFVDMAQLASQSSALSETQPVFNGAVDNSNGAIKSEDRFGGFD